MKKAIEYKVATCILHYGEPSLTGRVYEQIKAEPDVFVLDNAAPKEFVGAWKRLPENLFWAGAFEWALHEFSQRGYSHLWFFNNDAYFLSKGPHLKKAISRLSRMEELLGCIGIYSPSVTANPYHPQMVQDKASQCRIVSMVDGIAPLIHLTCAEEVGGLDALDNPYGYGVDTWLSSRVKKTKWKMVVDNQVLIRHNYHATANKIEGFLTKAAQAEQVFLENRLGPDYKTIIQEEQKKCQEINSLSQPISGH